MKKLPFEMWMLALLAIAFVIVGFSTNFTFLTESDKEKLRSAVAKHATFITKFGSTGVVEAEPGEALQLGEYTNRRIRFRCTENYGDHLFLDLGQIHNPKKIMNLNRQLHLKQPYVPLGKEVWYGSVDLSQEFHIPILLRILEVTCKKIRYVAEERMDVSPLPDPPRKIITDH